MLGTRSDDSQLPHAVVHETHSGVVLLLGDRAYKVKKPVDLGFLDFRTEEARRRACAREVELNRRLAPDVYLDVLSVLGSDGVRLEDIIVMRRMPEAARLSTLVVDGVPVEHHLEALARAMAGFHARAERSAAISAEGGPDGLRRRWEDNLRESEPYVGTVLAPSTFDEISRSARAYIDGRVPLLRERAEAGLSVDGHGDLIAEDVFCLPDGPRALDCLEFDDRLRWVDVLDDVAFLAMDLERLGRGDLGRLFVSRYLELSGTAAPSSLLHHYIAYRAFVRAKVACIRAAQGAPEAAEEAQAFAALSLHHLRAGEVVLVLVGGAPGTGKSTLASALATRRGAVVLSSDAVRRELADLPESERYGAAAKRRVYVELLERAADALNHGECVVADATWGGREERDLARTCAASTWSRLVELECRLPVDEAAARAERRLLAGGTDSEAGAAIALRLAAERDPWPEATAVDTHSEAVALEAALSALGGDGASPAARRITRRGGR